MRVPRQALYLCLLSLSAGASWAAGCAANGGGIPLAHGTGGGTTSTSSGSTSSGITISADGGGTGGGPSCTGLACQIHACPGDAQDDHQRHHLRPGREEPALRHRRLRAQHHARADHPGASCYTCGELYTGDPIAAALTDATGNFTIENAPDRRQHPARHPGRQVAPPVRPRTTSPSCTNTAVPDGMLTLPKNGTEGDIPNIAISTGGADTLECLLDRDRRRRCPSTCPARRRPATSTSSRAPTAHRTPTRRAPRPRRASGTPTRTSCSTTSSCSRARGRRPST